MRKRSHKLFVILAALVWLWPAGAFALEADLQKVWEGRADLQALFDAYGQPRGPSSGFLMNLEDWARQYGWSEHAELAAYRPVVQPPLRVKQTTVPFVNAEAWIVVDKASGQILAAEKAEKAWSLASISKLMTARLVSESDLDAWATIQKEDDVGGANLLYANGLTFRVRDLLYAALVGSANNAAHAAARSSSQTMADFVVRMNAEGRRLGLTHTTFADPTGIEPTNVSTAREVAYFAPKVWENEALRLMSQTYRKYIADAKGDTRQVTTTNWMIWKGRYADVWVMAGKTGYLNESMWNVVELVRPAADDSAHELVIVVFGAPDRTVVFDSVSKLAKWTWAGWEWD